MRSNDSAHRPALRGDGKEHKRRAMATSGRRALAKAGLALASAAFAGALFFYWRSLLDETVSTRRPILISELKPAGSVVAWRVPADLRAQRWHRTGVRVWESGRALPLRVQEQDMVTGRGAGRFCVQGDTLWFSASDSSSALSN